MAGQILFQDLADQSGIMRSIAELDSANKQFGDNAVAINKLISQSQNELKADLIAYKAELLSLGGIQQGNQTQIQTLRDNINQTSTAYRNQNLVIAQNESLLTANRQVIDQMAGRLVKLQQEYEKLDLTQKKDLSRKKEIEKELSQTTRAMDGLIKVTNQASKATETAVGSYAHLSKQTNELRAQLKNLPGAFDETTGKINKHNQAAVEMLGRIQANDKALKSMDGAMGVYGRQVGNYGTALKGFAGQLTGLTSGVAVAMVAFNAAKAGLEITQQMEAWDEGLKAVSRDSADFSHSQQFLMQLADRLGLQYGTLTESYKSLKAATKGTNLEGKETEHVFSAVTTAGAKLKLSNETISGTLTALVQMISKGHIQAEELRGQLGERLPGALKLMSEALGVSETKLNKMMEQGQLIATEVMPKFADSLDKAYGLPQNQKIETLSASTNRLKNETAYLLDEFNKGGRVTNFFARFTDGLAGALRDIKLFVKDGDWKDFILHFGSARGTNARSRDDQRSQFIGMDKAGRLKMLQDLQDSEAALRKKGQQAEADDVQKFRRSLYKQLGQDEIAAYGDEARQLTIAKRNAIDRNEADITRFTKQSALKRAAELNELEAKVAKDRNNEVLAHQLELYDRLDREQTEKEKAAKDRIKSQKPNNDSPLEQIDKQIKAIEATLQANVLQDLKEGKLIDKDDKIKAKLEQLKKLEDQLNTIKAIQALGEETGGKKRVTMTVGKATTSDLDRLGERPFVDMRLDSSGKEMDADKIQAADAKRTAQMDKELEKQSEILRKNYQQRWGLEQGLNENFRNMRSSEKAEILSLMQQIEDAERSGNQREYQNAKDLFDKKMKLLDKELEARKQLTEVSIEIGSTLVNGLFELEQEGTQNRMNELETRKQAELESVGESASAKAAVERKYDAESKRLKRQQDSAARNQALFNIALNTGQAIMKTYAEFGFPLGIPLAVAQGALGLVQAGLILARPLPQYKDGKNLSALDRYQGRAEVGEAGRELWFHDNRVDLVDRPSILNIGANDVILPNNLTEQLLESQAIQARTNQHGQTGEMMSRHRDAYQTRQMTAAIRGAMPSAVDIGREVGRANSKLPFNQTVFDQTGVHDYWVDGNTKTERLNKKHRLG